MTNIIEKFTQLYPSKIRINAQLSLISELNTTQLTIGCCVPKKEFRVINFTYQDVIDTVKLIKVHYEQLCQEFYQQAEALNSIVKQYVSEYTYDNNIVHADVSITITGAPLNWLPSWPNEDDVIRTTYNIS